MPFIGNQPALSYTSFAVQHFTTSATTSYTLDYSVTNELDIRLVINNVVQQPGSSYAYTASGTSLVLSSATSATDTMYAVFLGKAVQTVTPASGSVTNAMLGETITVANGGTGATTLAGAGLSNTPAFEAHLGSDQSVSDNTTTKVQFDTEVFDTDSAYDNSTNYRFTPQVAGKYYVYAFVRFSNSVSNSFANTNVMIYKNGSVYKNAINDPDNNELSQYTSFISSTIDFNGSSDYVEIFASADITAGTPRFESENKETSFGAYKLIGV